MCAEPGSASYARWMRTNASRGVVAAFEHAVAEVVVRVGMGRFLVEDEPVQPVHGLVGRIGVVHRDRQRVGHIGRFDRILERGGQPFRCALDRVGVRTRRVGGVERGPDRFAEARVEIDVRLRDPVADERLPDHREPLLVGRDVARVEAFGEQVVEREVPLGDRIVSEENEHQPLERRLAHRLVHAVLVEQLEDRLDGLVRAERESRHRGPQLRARCGVHPEQRSHERVDVVRIEPGGDRGVHEAHRDRLHDGPLLLAQSVVRGLEPFEDAGQLADVPATLLDPEAEQLPVHRERAVLDH